MERIGIDVSTHQGNINWEAVKGNIDFAIIRAGYGNNNIDGQAVKNVRGCEANNIPYGLYWFSYAYSVEMAIKEAEHLINFIGDSKPSYPLYFDFEYDSEKYANKNGVTVTKNLLTEMATAFCNTLEKAGYYAGIYANADYIVNHFNSDIFNKYDLWYAYWSSNCNRSVNMWQYTSSGTVPGISGNVDMNKCYQDYPNIMLNNTLNGFRTDTNTGGNEHIADAHCCKCSCKKRVEGGCKTCRPVEVK